MKEKMVMDNDVMNKILELQVIIKEYYGTLVSFEDILLFLENAMNYGFFQIRLLESKLSGVTLSYEETIKRFLDENSIDEILKLYDIEQNYGEDNIEQISTCLETSSCVEDDKLSKVKINKKSREILARAILR
ncbi:MAG: hypothetical protein HFH45_00220 [Bacilli bacterium]|nr:hypothetical protein [Bacilli bacterium]